MVAVFYDSDGTHGAVMDFFPARVLDCCFLYTKTQVLDGCRIEAAARRWKLAVRFLADGNGKVVVERNRGPVSEKQHLEVVDRANYSLLQDK